MKKKGVINPVHKPDSRFDPDSDAESQSAHETFGAEINEFATELPVENAEQDTEHDIQETVQRMLEKAVAHYEENLEDDQKKATDYFWARPFGDEEDGRSKVVSPDVRFATQSQMDILLDLFCGQEKVVEFRPKGAEDEAQTKQMTDYINFIVLEENNGFLMYDSAFKDALVRRIGIVKWWWEEFYRIEGETHKNLSEEQVAMLASDPEVQLDSSTLVQNDDLTFNVTLTRTKTDGCAKVAAIPPEEFVYTPDARGVEDAPLVAHIREVAAEVLIQMGVDPEEVKKAQGKKRAKSSESLDASRQYHEGATRDWNDDDGRDDSQQPVLYAEAYVLFDADGDGVAELRLCKCIGDSYKIVNGDGMGEIVDEAPFAIFTPYPEPHAMIGMSNWDLLRDVQRVKSQVLRGTLDSLSQSIEPRTEVVTGEVNMGDLLNPEVNGIIRVRRPGMMREVKHSFVGPDTMPMMEFFTGEREDATGTSRASLGLNAGELQSSTAAAVSGTLSAGQRRTKYIARVFAETGMKRLFKGLLKLVVRHQPRSRIVRLRGRYEEVDPRSWDASYDVTVTVGGDGTKEEKLAALAQIAEDQMLQFQNGSPLVGLQEIRNTRSRFVEALGFRNSAEFYKPWGEQEERAMQEAKQNQPPQPDANMALVQVEQQKAEAEMMIAQQKLELERQKAIWENDRERDRMAWEMTLKEKELELKFKADINDQMLKNAVAHARNEMDVEVQAQTPTEPTE